MVGIINDNSEILNVLFRTHQVVHAALFGSAAKNQLVAGSDIDILVEFAPEIDVLDYADNYFSLKFKLEDLFGREVDLVSSRSLKNPILIQTINESKIDFYAA